MVHKIHQEQKPSLSTVLAASTVDIAAVAIGLMSESDSSQRLSHEPKHKIGYNKEWEQSYSWVFNTYKRRGDVL